MMISLKMILFNTAQEDSRDFTRIAASDPIMWKDIFIDNSENILKVLNNFTNNLEELKKAILNKDEKKLISIFTSTKKSSKRNR